MRIIGYLFERTIAISESLQATGIHGEEKLGTQYESFQCSISSSAAALELTPVEFHGFNENVTIVFDR